MIVTIVSIAWIQPIALLQVDEMVKKITAVKARKNLGQLLEEVYYRGDHYIIERAGKPMAAVVPVWYLEEWLKRRERFFDMVDEVRQGQEGISPEAVEQDIQNAINTWVWPEGVGVRDSLRIEAARKKDP
jgi:prevent-host-death family protein